MARQQHAVAFLGGEFAQGGEYVVASDGVEPRGGFVEHEQIGLVRKRHDKLQFHAHAAGEIFHFRLARKRKPLGEAPELRFVPGGEGGREAALHLCNGEFRWIGAGVEHHADA